MRAAGPIVVLALVAAACASGARDRPRTASRGAVEAFLAEARRGFSGSFTLRYEVTVRYSSRFARRILVNVAQRTAEFFSYRTTPSLDLSAPGGPPASYSYEVLVKPAPGAAPGAGIYSCRKQFEASPWTCQGPYTQIGMGGTNQLLGPYPPQALVLGLDNAVAVYTGDPSVSPIRPEPAFLITRRVSGRRLRCLEFGPAPRPAGSVCLRHDDLIVSYRLSGAVTSGPYDDATLLSYSPHVANDGTELPAARIRAPA